MAAASILTVAATAADSSDVVVAASTTVGLKGQVDAKAEVLIKLKDDAGGYNTVGRLTSAEPATVIAAAGTYRFSRVAGGTCGVFSG